MRTIMKYLKPYYPRMAAGIGIKALGTLMDLGLPWVLAYIIDDVIPVGKVRLIFWWGLVMVIMSVLARTFNIMANRMAASVSRDTTRILRHDLFEKILHLSGKQMDYFTVPSLESRMTSDTYNIHSMIGMMQRIGIRAPILLFGGITLTATLEPVLTLVLVGTLPFLILTVYIVSKKGFPLYSRLQVSVDRMVRVVRDNITGIRVIKALSKTAYEKERFAKVNEQVSESEQKAGMIMAVSNPLMNLLMNLGLTLVVVVGAYRVNAGASQPGKIVAFLSYFAIILQALMAITRIFVMYSKGNASAVRIEEVLAAEEDLLTYMPESGMKANEIVDESKNENRNENKNENENINIQEDTAYSRDADKEIHIEFDHVNFSYTEEPCIQDISFQIKKGESLGIIGSTGSGKTTLINLLMRFYDINEGSIKINGIDIRTMNKQELRKRFGVVFQNDVLFADSIHENISIGREMKEQEVKDALREAQAEFVNSLEDRAEHMLTIKGSNLSGGQRQRVLIARALAGEPEILILDDSSSALDYKTDSLLRKAIQQEHPETTKIMIAQRISSVMKLDRILVLEDGQTAGYGSHEELLDSCEVYREIYQSQLMDE